MGVIFPRCSGILLHVTSLPCGQGIGDLGRSAYELAQFLAASGQKIWQVLPLSPTGYGDSPYQSFSAFAGNPLFIDLNAIRDEGLLSPEDLVGASNLHEGKIDYVAVGALKQNLLRKAGRNFLLQASGSERQVFEEFCDSSAGWLDDYALFIACKDSHQGKPWVDWDFGLQTRNPTSLKEWGKKLESEISVHKFVQFEFFRQWERLKTHCSSLGIRIMGDVPIYVAHDSADVWSHPELFRLDELGRPAAVAGVPPDYFSATGQLWGNPLYRWDAMAASGYKWWIDRFRASLRLFDILRLDHFRGFEAYWEIPANAPTAASGQWVKGPGAELFHKLQSELKTLPLVAENLGVITPEVEALRTQFGFPGMSLLQFAFGNDPQGPTFRPHNYSRELVAYTGGHDNDTTIGWWTSVGTSESTRSSEDIRKERDFARSYLGFSDEPINWALIRAVLASVADVAIVPLQDVLGLGSEARMNLPGTATGNWRWRYQPGALSNELSQRLRDLTLLYDR